MDSITLFLMSSMICFHNGIIRLNALGVVKIKSGEIIRILYSISIPQSVFRSLLWSDLIVKWWHLELWYKKRTLRVVPIENKYLSFTFMSHDIFCNPVKCLLFEPAHLKMEQRLQEIRQRGTFRDIFLNFILLLHRYKHRYKHIIQTKSSVKKSIYNTTKNVFFTRIVNINIDHKNKPGKVFFFSIKHRYIVSTLKNYKTY